MANLRRLHLRQLEDQLESYRRSAKQPRPRAGWIREIRKALGMTTQQLAKRMRLSQPSVTLLEQGEAKGSITLSSLQKAASALDCELVYALVPRERLEDRLLQRSRELAQRQISPVSHTMALEE